MKKLLAAVLAAVMAMSLCACNPMDYKKAVKLYEEGSFEKAKAIFEGLGEYKDSADLMNECGYQIADKALNDEDFRPAVDGFKELGDYKDSAEKLAEAEDALIRSLLVGTWNSKPVDLSTFYTESFAESDDSGEMGEYFKFSDIIVVMTLEFDGSQYTLGYDPDSLDSMSEKLSEQCGEGMMKMIEDQMTALAEEEGITLDDIYELYGASDVKGLLEALYGMDFETYIATLMDQALHSGMTEMEESGTFTVEDGAVYLNGKNMQTGSFSLDDNTLTLTDTKEEISEAAKASIYPITFSQAD